MKNWLNVDEKFTNVVAFFLFGSIENMYSFGISLAAGEDILANTALPTSMVYVCDVLPYFLSCLILPMLLDKISPLAAVLAVFALMTTGAVLIAVPKVLAAKLVGVCLVSLSCGFNETILLPLTAFYHDITMKAFIFGTGCGGLFGMLYYTGKQINRSFSYLVPCQNLLVDWHPREQPKKKREKEMCDQSFECSTESNSVVRSPGSSGTCLHCTDLFTLQHLSSKMYILPTF